MFHAINAWLACQARRARDYRLARDNQIAAATSWQVQRIAASSYHDPRFSQYREALRARALRHAACGAGSCRYSDGPCTQDPLTTAGRRR